jgi:hypothetical protein
MGLYHFAVGIIMRAANHRRPLVAKAALLLLAGTTLGGCEVWNAWLDMLKWKGDNGQAKEAPLAAQPGTVAPGKGGGASAGPVALIPRVTVYRITLPVGSFSTNDKIWAQLNEDAVDSKTTVMLAQNGLRAATGPVGRWPNISQLLQGTAGALTEQFVYQTDGRSSVNVVTRAGVTDQIVVSIDRDLQQQGRTFERCDNGFRLAMKPVKNKPELVVQLEPTVTLGTVNVIRTGPELGVTRTGFSSEETFPDLNLAANLTADQFLVVSAMDPKGSPFSVGTLWLSDQEKAPPTETVLIFVPAPVAAPPAAPTPAKASAN